IVRDAAGRIRHELTLGAGASRELRIQEPIVPARGTSVKPPTPIGFVEVGMRRDWIDREIDRAAWTNISITGILSLAILALGGLVISRLVARTRELVGEAELVEEVKRANAELETFSYSVAHDLRAPARAIISFSQMLTEDYADKLDEEGRDYLRRVHAGGRRMEELIDDLLSLSRVTRSTIARQWFDLSEVARQVCSQLKDSQPERAVEFVVQDGLSAEADPNLARTLLENLLGNAWKYTMKHARARVEFGRAEREGETIYFVRDDGAGFNMDYAGKLFKPFSRLHQASEFAGAGIGLATVHRIIERHGGRIWAESAVEKGSTFYFTLGERT
ncbi:MAG: hypothetical protein KGK30_10170, partial [Elusimicrobia bacterium]|nr:hypothetical protein [Elusimicrobiota bacterium]